MKMLRENKSRSFANEKVYSLLTDDGYPVEVTDTFLPYYTKDAIGAKQNALKSYDIADRTERWMIGVSCMSGCPVECKFCATGQLSKWRALSAEEIVAQVMFILEKNPEYSPTNAKEFKINYTRMGEPFLNIDAVKDKIFRYRVITNLDCNMSPNYYLCYQPDKRKLRLDIEKARETMKVNGRCIAKRQETHA